MSKRKDMLDALRRKQRQREARRLPVRVQDEMAVRRIPDPNAST